MLKDKKLNEVYYQPDHHLCTDGKEIRELCKIVPTTKKDARHGQQIAKFTHIAPPKDIKYPQFDSLYVPHNVFEESTCKHVLIGVDATLRCKVARPLRMKEATKDAILLEAVYKKGGAFKY